MRASIVLTLLFALVLSACSASTDGGGSAGEEETTGIDPQALALGPGDLPDAFSVGTLTETTPGEAPPGCDVFGDLGLDDEVGVSYEAAEAFQAVEMRIAAGSEAQRIVGGLDAAAECPDADYADDEGTAITGSFDRVEVPAGAAASFTGTAGGFPFVMQFAGFSANGHTVTISVVGIGGLPDDVDLSELVQLTVDRAAGEADPAPDAPELTEPVRTNEEDGGPDTSATTAPPENSATAEASRDHPLAVGDSATVEDWDVTLDDVQLDAADAIAQANEFNEPSSNGNYALVTLTATYLGDDEGDAGFGLSVTLSGTDNRQYADHDCMAVEPDPMTDQPTVENDGTVTGQFCIDYPDEALGADAVLFVESVMSFDQTRRYWQLPG